jgi:hypothetical protein
VKVRLHNAIEEVERAEVRLARELERVGSAHADEPDIHNLSRTLARRCEQHLQELAPYLDKYPAGADSALLDDLRRLYLAAHEAELAWTMLLQGALVARDPELIEAVLKCQEDAQNRWRWVRTRLKETAPSIMAEL